jgi:hypothetical protein
MENFSKNMLTKLKIPFASINEKLYILGEHAFEFANLLGKEMLRPMREGFLSPYEKDAIPVIKLFIETLLGRAPKEGEICYYSRPGQPLENGENLLYHRGVFETILKELGYTPKDIVEGHAVVLAELGDQDFTGIGISCGAGLTNVCISYKTIPIISFSISRGGDWIDENVARVLGIKQERATLLKEKGVDLMKTETREKEAIVIYFRSLINYIFTKIKEHFELKKDAPAFIHPIDIVCAGGCTLANGFKEIFMEELQNAKLPFEIKNIRISSDPLHAVAKGALFAALSEE